MDVVVQALAVLASGHAFGRYGRIAASEGVDVADEFEQHIHRLHVAVGAEIGAKALVNLACLEDAREVLVRHDDAGVGLAVLQQDVVLGVPLLDEVVFEQQRVFLGVHDDVLDVANVLHQALCLQVLVLFLEVRRYPALQPFCLAHVDDGARIVEILVAAGLVGQVAYDALQVFLQFFLCAFLHHVAVV